VNNQNEASAVVNRKAYSKQSLHDFAPQHIYGFAVVAQLHQPLVSLKFFAPCYDNCCKILLKKKDKQQRVMRKEENRGISGDMLLRG